MSNSSSWHPSEDSQQSIQDFATLLQLQLQRGHYDLDTETLADIFWLARYIGTSSSPLVINKSQLAKVSPTTNQSEQEVFNPQSEDVIVDLPKEAPVAIQPTQVEHPTSQTSFGVGLPLQIPAASALRSQLELSRALRPLMRRIPSPTQTLLDEEATAVQIAVQELYAPVLIPAPERWFDLAIVVEESPSLAIWEDTIVELQELVECQGAFRQIRTWRLKGRQGKAPEIKLNWQPNHVNECSYKASALNDPTGRRIIWVVSDCTSVLWEQPQLYEILAQWGKFSPLTLIQLFPEQLWNSTALEMGHLVSIRSAYPGAAHARLTAEVIPLYTNLLSAASLQQPQKHLTLPIISLEPEPLNHWAKVTTGTANSSMIGIQINLEELIAESAEDSADTVALNPQERIDAFRANASITAQKLAGLMASVPVSLPIVHLIQKAMLPQSRQVHVAEVFMGGLMELVETAADNQKTVKELQFPSYRFIEEVREQLIETLPISKTLRVIDILSAHISEKLGLGTKSFTALIADPRLQPDQRQELQNFANIPLRTLKRLGGDYQELAEELEQNYDYLRNTSKSTSNSTRTLNEAKILLVGDVGVGKTSLVHRLIHNSFTSDGTVNEGISITQWVINVNHQDVKLNVWDFGWQEIVHATHQFFLTTNCLYLLVLDASQDETDNRAEYWLKIIHSFGGDSPVIIVTNKVDQNSLELNLKSFRQKYPNIADVVQTSCKDQKGITQLTLAIQSQIMSLPHVFNALPKSWFSVKEHLENIRANYITYSQYQAVCFEHAILDEQQQILIGLLHDLGIVLNFLDDPRLRNTNILNPRWVTHGIYKILNAHDLADNKGELDIGCLTQLLDTQNYPRERHGFLMELMRKFELCFPFQDSQDRYLIPDLLDKQQPPNAEDFILEDCLNFRYEYSILPEGLLPRFIVRTHVLSSNPLRWRTGVILDFEGNRALVKADRQDRSVTISINGPQQGRRRLLAIIRSDFERIHSSFKTQPEEKVPTPKHPQLSLNYDDLLVMEKQGLTEVPMVIDAQVIQININDLLNGVDLDKPKLTARESEHSSGALKLFYSYSYKDEALRDQLEIRLRLLQRNGLIQSWHDRQIPPGKDWDEELDRNLEQADIILLLVSPNFIASDYCYEVEMTRARERHDAKEAILIPILIRPVDWHTVPFNDIQALPSDLKPVTKWLDKDDAWLNIEQGIKQVIQSIKKDKSL